MASHWSFVIGGILLLLFTCHSAPVEKINLDTAASSKATEQKEPMHQEMMMMNPAEAVKPTSVQTSTSPSLSTTSTVATGRMDSKQKRDVDEDQIDLGDELFLSENDENIYPYSTLNDDDDEDNNEHILFTKMKETPATIHGHTDRLLDTDDSDLFSDLQMNPNELTTILRRRRRDVKLMNPLNQRRKRSLSSHNYFDADSFYDPWASVAEEQSYLRPLRSFAPIYWYPPLLERNVRSYQETAWPVEYINPLVIGDDDDDENDDDDDDDDDDESPISIYDADDNDEIDYEINRYPILMKSQTGPFDNLQLQRTYNTDDLPLDEFDEDPLLIVDDADENDDGDEYPILYEPSEPVYIRYNPVESYLEV